jgi:YfiH family protein
MLILRAANLAPLAHGFFGRRGGVSTGLYSSLNCALGAHDAPEAIAENRARVAAALAAAAPLITLQQVHSARVVTVDAPFETPPQADAMVTCRPRLILGILTADCAPILFADRQAGVIGAAHAGWKGALGGVSDATLAAMEKLGADRRRIKVAIGPCNAQENYEVGADFAARFTAADPANKDFFTPSDRADRHRFNLGDYLLRRLAKAGIADAERLAACTYARESDFFSFRRATHRGEPDYGREISAIALTG